MKGNRLEGNMKLVRTGENGKRIMDALEEWERKKEERNEESEFFSSHTNLTSLFF